MPFAVLMLVLLAAFAHAGWNVIAKGARGGAAFVWLSAVAGSVVWLPVLAVALVVDRGRLDWLALAFMAASGALHAFYFVSLQRGYDAGDLSLVYPLARGTGPLLATLAAIVFFGEHPSLVAMLGAATIVASVLMLAQPSGHANRRAVGFALLTGTAIASYTLLDKQAVDTYALGPIVYYWGTNACNAALLTPYVLRRRVSLALAWRSSRLRALGVGVLSPLAYVLILFALTRAPVSYVAPAREMSILIATVIGATVLAERDGRRRIMAAGAIVIGVAALAIG